MAEPAKFFPNKLVLFFAYKTSTHDHKTMFNAKVYDLMTSDPNEIAYQQLYHTNNEIHALAAQSWLATHL